MDDPVVPALLASFVERYSPQIAAQARTVMARLRRLLPGAVELIYDNYNALVVAFATTEKKSDIILSVVLYPRWISLFFLHGAVLSDPQGLLKGEGPAIRHVVLEPASKFDTPEVQALIHQAASLAVPPLPADSRNRQVIKFIAEKQRARRPSPPAPKRKKG
jgi:hypothetical protein